MLPKRDKKGTPKKCTHGSQSEMEHGPPLNCLNAPEGEKKEEAALGQSWQNLA